MKANIRAEGFTFKDIIDDMKELEVHIGEASVEGIEALAQVVESSMKTAYGKSGDFIADSIGYNVEMGADQQSAVASVGVFHVDAVAAKHYKFTLVKPDVKGGVGMAKMGITAPQAAWWREYGTISQPAKPFLETGYLSSLKQQEEAVINVFNKAIDKVSKS